VAYALPGVRYDAPIEVAAGATIADALDGVSNRPAFDRLDLASAPVGVFNELIKDRAHPLREGDRVEIYRPLEVDPMTARAQRAGNRAKV